MLRIEKVLSWMFRCCGIAPKRSHIDKYFAIPAIILIMSLPLMSVMSRHRAHMTSERLFQTLMMFLSAFATIWLIISNWMEPERYMKIMKDLESIGNQVKSTNDCRILKISCGIIVGLTLIQFGIFYQIGFYFAMYVLAVVLLVITPSLQHVFVVQRIQNRFSALNDLISGTSADMPLSRTELDNVFYVHSFLHNLVVDVDGHFCFFILLMYVSKFIFCVFVMYGYLVSIENVNERLDFPLLLNFLRQVVVFVSQALVCHACSKEANRTVLLAHRLLKPDTPLDLWEDVGLFSALAFDNKVHFTVGGIFTLDRVLITQTALTALSYLIITIQLREIQLF